MIGQKPYKRARKFLPQGNAPELEYQLYLASESTFAFGKKFLADFNKSEPSIFHIHFCDELDMPVSDPLFSIVARGHAKTTICKANIVRDFCFTAEMYKHLYEKSNSHLKEYWYKKWKEKEKLGPHYYIWIAKSQDDSISNAKYIKDNLTQNQEIIKIFGNMKGPVWNREYIETRDGYVLQCGSNLKGVRGKNISTATHGALRITRVYLDDAENEENTKTYQSRREIKKKVFAAIMPAIQHEPYCRLIVTGTPVHFDSMIQNMLDDVEMHYKNGTINKFPFKVIVYKATQPKMKGGVLWHSFIPRKQLNIIKDRYAAANELALYYQEYELEVAGSDVATWTRQHIKIYDGYFKHSNGINYMYLGDRFYECNTFIGCDPATDIETRTSDFSVISAVAVLKDNSRYSLGYERHLAIPTIGIRDDEGEFLTKKGVVDHIVEMYDKFHAELATVENVAMTRSVFQSINAFKMKFNRYDVNITPISPAGKNKHNKIYTYFDPLFANGLVHVRPQDDALINEILRFGALMPHDDTIESFYFANRNAYPPTEKIEEKNVFLSWEEKREMLLLNRRYYLQQMQNKLPWFLKDREMNIIEQ